MIPETFTAMDVLFSAAWTANALIILRGIHKFGIPYVRKKFWPTTLERLQEGDKVLVDTDKIYAHEWRSIRENVESIAGKLSGEEILYCTHIMNYDGYKICLGVNLHNSDGPPTRHDIIDVATIEREESIIAIYEEECENCNSSTVYSKKRNKFVCPFCEIE